MSVGRKASASIAGSEELQRRVLVLEAQLADLRAREQGLMLISAEISRRLQMSSAAVKAAVTSLLDYDIFWGGSTQQEFLETIDSSVDQIADLSTLMALASRSVAGLLRMTIEPHALPEILSAVQDHMLERMPNLALTISFPADGDPVRVDYEYLSLSLRLLLEALATPEAPPRPIQVLAEEHPDRWQVDLGCLTGALAAAIAALVAPEGEESIPIESIAAENALRLLIACRLLRCQNALLAVDTDASGVMWLRISLPAGTRVEASP